MTVSTNLNRVDFTGNGSTTVFPFTFKVPESSHLVVSTRIGEVETILVLDTDYSITGVGAEGGGSVTYPLSGAALPSTSKLVIKRELPIIQETDLRNQGSVFPETMEESADKIVMQQQQLSEQVGRAIQVQDTPSSGPLTADAPVAGKLQVWKDDVSGLKNVSLADISDTKVFTSSITWNFDTLAGAVASDYISSGDRICLIERTAGNGGGAFWDVVLASTVTPDSFGIVQCVGSPSLALVLVDEVPVNAKAYGVIGGDDHDDTGAFIAALASCKTSFGGLLSVRGCRTIKLTEEIELDFSGLKIIGDGRLGVYPTEDAGGFSATNKLSTFLIDHNDRNGFKFSQNGSARGLEIDGVNFIRKTGSTCIAALGFDTEALISDPSFESKDYGYDINIRNCGIFNFVSGIDLYRSGVNETTMAFMSIDNCAINKNEYITRTLDSTKWNGFKFTNNKAGQNTVGGIDIEAHGFTEFNNSFEGQPNPIKVTGGLYRGFNSSNSYFELNTGRALIELGSVSNPNIGTHAVFDDNTDAKIFIQNAGLVKSQMPYIGGVVYKAEHPEQGNSTSRELILPSVDTAVYPIASMNSPSVYDTKPPYRSSAKTLGAINESFLERMASPYADNTLVAARRYTSSGSGSLSSVLTIAGNANDYVTVTYLVKSTLGAGADLKPYVDMNVNGTSAAGSRQYSFETATEYFDKSEYAVVSTTIKLGVAMTSLTVLFYPFGLAPAAGLVADISRGTCYVTDKFQAVKPYLDARSLITVDQAPFVGTWQKGDKFLENNPVVGQPAEFVNTAAGSPGTWSSYGTIA